MEDIKKWFAAPERAPMFEVDVSSHDEAVEYVEKNFRGSGEVRVIEVVYRAITQTPYFVNTH